MQYLSKMRHPCITTGTLYYENTYIYMNIYVYLDIDRKKPPSLGCFLFTMFPHQEPCVRGLPSKDLYQVLRGGSSYTRFLIGEHSK